MLRPPRTPEFVPGSSAEPWGELNKAAERVASARQRLQWAVDFASIDLDRVPAWHVEELRQELFWFARYAIGVRIIYDLEELPSDAEMRQAQGGLRELISDIIAETDVRIGAFHVELALSWLPTGGAGARTPHLDEWGPSAMAWPVLARWALVMSVIDQARAGVTIKACPGPIPHRSGVCGRWFVGTPKKKFCSAPCRARATDRLRRPPQTVLP